MRRIVFSAKAQADIEAIADFIAEDNPIQAVRFVAALRVRCMALAIHPFQGRPIPEVGDGVRCLVFRSYLVLHRVFDDHVAVDRVIHGARDRSTLALDE